jgi:hypothetical protein
MKKYALMLLLSSVMISMPAYSSKSLCSKNEQIVFSCSLGKKTLSVCASSNISPTSGYLQYRLGKKNKAEIAFPDSSKIADRKLIQARTLMFAGGGGAYLRFINGSFNYVVFTAIGRGWGTKDGVSVLKNGKPIANLMCQDVPVSLMGDDFFTRAGLGTDDTEFVLP